MKKLHRVLGLLVSGVLLTICVTGVMLVWKREYLWVTIPQARELPQQEPTQSQHLSNALARIIDSHAEGEVTFVRFYDTELSLHKVYLNDRRYAWHAQDGEHVETWKGNERFEAWLLDLHHRLLLGNTYGLNAVGFTGLIVIILFFLGFRIWWPWRRGYRANMMPSRSDHGNIRRSHFQTGVNIFLPALVLVISGVILIYPTESRYMLLGGFSKPKTPTTQTINFAQFNAPMPRNNEAQLKYGQWQSAIERLENYFPEARVRWISLTNNGHTEFTVGLQPSNSWNAMGNVSVAFLSDGLVKIKRQSEQSTMARILDYVYPVHAGKFPTLYRLFLSATGLLLAWLCILGVTSYLKRSKR